MNTLLPLTYSTIFGMDFIELDKCTCPASEESLEYVAVLNRTEDESIISPIVSKYTKTVGFPAPP